MTTERKATYNSTYKKLAVQWLNDPDSYREWWQTVFVSEIANFL